MDQSRTVDAAAPIAESRVSAVAFFDGIGTAHSLPLIAGLDAAAANEGLRREWTTAIRPPASAEGDCRWTSTKAFYAEYCETGRSSSFAYRIALQEALRRAAASGADLFCDLAVEQLTTSYGAPLRVDMPAVWIVHQPPQPPDGRALLARGKAFAANPKRVRWAQRAAHARAVLRHLERRGGTFLVPSAQAHKRLGRVVSADRIRLAPWPIISAAAPPPLAAGTPGEIVAIMPGEARAGKGLDVLLAALGDVPGVTALDLPSVATSEAQQLVRGNGDRRIVMDTGWVSNEEYARRLHAASLAVLPYRSAAAANGGISASLLDALAVGLPVVVTESIARVLPPGFGGAVVVASDSATALAAGITRAVDNLDALAARAREEGPAYILANHTYEQYLRAIVDASR